MRYATLYVLIGNGNVNVALFALADWARIMSRRAETAIFRPVA